MPIHIDEMDGDEEREPPRFCFHALHGVAFASVGSERLQPLLDKWGFGPDMTMCRFRVEQVVTEETAPAMLEAFFRDREVLGTLHSLTRLRVTNPDKVRVYNEKLFTNAVSMTFLNKFEECGAISHTGHIRGRIEEDYEGVPINNLLREVIFMEESELWDAFSAKDRKEFLFRIFSHVICGGAQNQYEDHVELYFEATKAIYKDLLSVRRSDTGDVEVVSIVHAIHSLGEGGLVFPKESLLNFCYVVLDPLTRHITFWYFGYRPLW